MIRAKTANDIVARTGFSNIAPVSNDLDLSAIVIFAVASREGWDAGTEVESVLHNTIQGLKRYRQSMNGKVWSREPELVSIRNWVLTRKDCNRASAWVDCERNAGGL
jgi:hypothetical protein